MNNTELAAVAIRNWLSPIVKSVGNNIKIPATKGIGKFITTYFGIDLTNYNILNELDFIIDPTLDYFVRPYITKLSNFIPDENIPVVINRYVDSAIDKAKAKGSVNIFGFEFEATAFENLKKELDKSFNSNSHDERSE